TRLQGDWSSDVCSSDLVTPQRSRGGLARLARSSAACAAPIRDRSGDRRLRRSPRAGRGAFLRLRHLAPLLLLLAEILFFPARRQIGRASCRERVELPWG